ncbi:MAG TPA: hypothetical protein P5531_02740 [Bacteroidales bacterium]|nr:hypothetical protein [Bacteroidales bacterium]HSA44882.1 hypothetical protein [Bacteroidales bacterium]
MARLSLSQVEQVTAEVRRQQVSLGHLPDDLVDHLCCAIEDSIERGMNFSDAYHRVVSQAGDLKEIQNATLYLIDKNYRRMKNTVKITGVISMILIALGTMLRLMQTTGGNLMIICGFGIIGLLFFPAALYVIRRETQQQDQVLIYLLALTGGLGVIAGILFRVMHWPGAFAILSAGYILLAAFLTGLLVSRQRFGPAIPKPVYWSGATSMMISSIGFLFKVNHYPGAAVILILGAAGMCLVFLPLWAHHEMKYNKGVTATFIFFCVGILYFNMFNLLLAIR